MDAPLSATPAKEEAKTVSDMKAQPRKMSEVVFDVSQGISNAILAVLGMGLLMSSIGNIFHYTPLIQAGLMGQKMLAPALGVGIAMMMRANILTTGAALIAATVGSNAVYFTSAVAPATHTATGWVADQAAGSLVMTSGQPVSAVLAALVAVLVGNWLTGKTPLDMMLVPLGAVLVGTFFGLATASVTTPFLNWVSEELASTMKINPFLGAFVVAVVWFLFLMTPASSAALAIAVMLDPLSGGAALVGTTAGFVMYTAMGWKQNDLGANLAQVIVTPKVQFPNLLKSPLLLFGPAVIAGISAVLAVGFFDFKVPYAIAGLGLNGFIAPIALATTDPRGFALMVIFGVVVPTLAGLVFYYALKKLGKTKKNDLHLDVV
ncbi:membrane protein [Leuconostoc litchii]|uniref:PTS sugar transporter subunit IIC n=1 Tax=Leuconostoc litchii TaxID=1981069 RepID=A0A652NE21_9LACO|nr:PTS sugar transporter subunit IIC [Leuconostoc litchii]TYC46517.1 PTS sugar transporter subunit IIC [Leuconostoc litchii]GMA70166.1 membrane protein [Leuconostoc litchii]